MSRIKDQIDQELKNAMLEKKELELNVYRSIKTALKNAEIEKKGEELSEDEILSVLEKQAKQRRDSISEYEKGGRADLAEKEKAELSIIEKFLPEKMGEDEIREVVKKKVAEMQGQDFGRVMGAVMGELKGKADGGAVGKILKEELEK